MNRFENITKPLMWLMALLLTAFMAGCGGGGGSSAPSPIDLNSDKVINTFSLAWTTRTPGGTATGTVDQTMKTITVPVPHRANIGALFATFTTSPGVTVTVGSVPQESGLTQNDYSLPVSYKVTAADGTWATYTVIVNRDQTVTSLAVTPATASIPVGATQQFAANAHYLDLSIDDVTATASWTSAASGVASVGSFDTVGTPGLATGRAVGTSDITATFSGQTDTAVLTVNPAALVSLDISPVSAVIAVGTTQQFLAKGTYTDGSTNVDVTTTTSWTSAASGVASVQTMGDPTPGLATGVTADPTAVVITATKDGKSATANLTVIAAPGPNLLRTASFAVLAGSTITNAGITNVTGDVGATGVPAAAPNVTGNYYPLGTEQPYVDAKADLPTVIAEANSTTSFPCGAGPTYNRSGDLIGAHLAPGVTCFTGAILNTGVVTLDGPGVYIIRTTGGLTPAAGSSVAYGTGTGGTATALNTTVYWVVGLADITSAVGTPVIWKGTILTDGAVTLGDSATLVNGRVLTTGPVTLTNNTITKP